MAKSPAAPTPAESAAEQLTGKGRATPSRAEQEAARKRPLVVDTKESRARARAELAAKRDKARVGMANGDERYLQARDKGPQRKFVRDWVDSRWSLGELIMPAMVLVIIALFVPGALGLQYYVMIGLWIFILFVIVEGVVTSIRVKRAAAKQFGADRRERGLGWYAFMRQVQMRFLRLPKPKVKRGGAPV